MLLYLVKHSRPDISNATRELSKHMSGANGRSMKEMLRIIKYVIDTKNWGLKIEPKYKYIHGKWRIVLYTDADWAGDKDTIISVGGFILYICRVPIMCHSKAQKGVMLSSGIAERSGQRSQVRGNAHEDDGNRCEDAHYCESP